MTVTRTPIGSGRPLFILPGDRFINATKPLQRAFDQQTLKAQKDKNDATENHARR